MSELNEFKNFAKYLADVSARVIKPYFRTKVQVDFKEDATPVTIADRKAEELMRGEIKKEFPDHGIIGEEFGEFNGDAEYKWVLDPIDGTKSFICGALSFGTLIALLCNNQPILGIINHPILNEFLMGDNNSTEINGVKTMVRKCSSISEAVLLTTDYLNINKYQNAFSFDKLMKQVKLYREWGDCYGYYLVATGFADIMIDPIMSLWDSMALIPILNGAGGVITDYHGNAALEGNSIVAASPGVHSEVIKILNS